MRTTINIDAPVLSEVKKLGRSRHKSLGHVVSELLGRALRDARQAPVVSDFSWVSKPMKAKVDLKDRESLYEAIDRETGS